MHGPRLKYFKDSPCVIDHMAEEEARLDERTQDFVQQLYDAWSSNAPEATYASLRDGLLIHRERVDTRIATLRTVAKIAHPDGLDDDAQWESFFNLADVIERYDGGDHRRRTCSHNEANRLRNVSLVAALWSPAIVFHYGWHKAGQVQINTIRACALTYPCFVTDFCPRLNSLLLTRHCEGLQGRRRKTINEAPLQPHRDFDLLALALVVVDDGIVQQWLTNEDGNISVNADGTKLSTLRPSHFRMYLLQKDPFGVLVARDASSAAKLAPAFTVTPRTTTGLALPSTGRGVNAASSCRQHVRGDTPSVQSGSHVRNTSHEPHAQNAVLGAREPATPRSSLPVSQSNVSTPFDPFTYTGAHDPGNFTPAEPLDHNRVATTEDSFFLFDAPTPGISAQLYYAHALTPLERRSPSDVRYSLYDETILSCNPSLLQLSNSRPDVSSATSSETSLFSQDRAAASDTSPDCALSPATVDDLAQSDSDQDVEMHDESDDASIRDSDSGLNHPKLLPRCLIPHFTIASPVTEMCLTMEEILHTQYRDQILDYAAKLKCEADSDGAGGHRDSRVHWLNSDTKWASIFTQPSSELPSGRARSSDDADVLYFTSDEVIAAAQESYIFRKPIVIKERFSDSGMHTFDDLVVLLQDTKNVVTTKKDQIGQPQPETETTPLNTLVNRMQGNPLRPGANASTLSLRNITKSHRPLLTMIPRFRLLDSLAERARGSMLGKGPDPTDMASCISFNTLSYAGAYSGAYLDSLSGSWVRNLDGFQLWLIVPEVDMQSEWETFAVDSDWNPNGKQRLILLEQDDVLLMPPGLRTVRCMHSPKDSVVEGGIIWDELNVVQILYSVRWICQHQPTTHETTIRQLPRIVKELEDLVREQPDRFKGRYPKADFIHAFEDAVLGLKALGCHCTGSGWEDSDICVCRRERRHCSPWCTTFPSSDHSKIMDSDRTRQERDTGRENSTDERD